MKRLIVLTFASLVVVAVVVATVAVDAHGQTRRRRRPLARRPTVSVTESEPKPTEPSSAATNSVPAGITTASGLTYLITRHGAGRQPKAGETVVVHYTGTLTDGVKFDSSRDAGTPISFKLGAGRVIKGWDEGIARLHIGDQAILIIPPQLGYGATGAGGVIPPDATLIFIVELVDVQATP